MYLPISYCDVRYIIWQILFQFFFPDSSVSANNKTVLFCHLIHFLFQEKKSQD